MKEDIARWEEEGGPFAPQEKQNPRYLTTEQRTQNSKSTNADANTLTLDIPRHAQLHTA